MINDNEWWRARERETTRVEVVTTTIAFFTVIGALSTFLSVVWI